MSTPTNSFPAAASFALTDTFLMNVAGASSKVTGTNVITSLGAATLSGANTFTGQNTFTLLPVISNPTNGTGPSGSLEVMFKNAVGTGLGSASGAGGTNQLVLFAGNVPVIAAQANSAVTLSKDAVFGFSDQAGISIAGFNPDAAFARAATKVVEVNSGTAGGGAGLQLNEMTAPAGAANSARLFTQDLAGKTQLMVIFGSGVAQQLAIEL